MTLNGIWLLCRHKLILAPRRLRRSHLGVRLRQAGDEARVSAGHGGLRAAGSLPAARRRTRPARSREPGQAGARLAPHPAAAYAPVVNGSAAPGKGRSPFKPVSRPGRSSTARPRTEPNRTGPDRTGPDRWTVDLYHRSGQDDLRHTASKGNLDLPLTNGPEFRTPCQTDRLPQKRPRQTAEDAAEAFARVWARHGRRRPTAKPRQSPSCLLPKAGPAVRRPALGAG
jgi:hypothetical protein